MYTLKISSTYIYVDRWYGHQEVHFPLKITPGPTQACTLVYISTAQGTVGQCECVQVFQSNESLCTALC